MNALGSYLEDQLKQRGWDQKELSARSGVRESTISRLLRGKVQEPQLSTLHALAECLSVDLGLLIELAGYPIRRSSSEQEYSDRFQVLVEAFPWLLPVAINLASLPLAQRDPVISMLEALAMKKG